MQRPNYGNPPPAHSPPLHHPVPQHVSTVPQLRSPPPPQPPSQPQSGYGYGQQAGGMPPQQGGYGVHPSFGGFINDPTAQLGFQMGKSAVDAGQHYMEQNLGRFVSVSALKHYFNVTNSYVLTKLRIILIPWWHRPWSRQQRHAPDSSASSAALLYQPPREDVNSPDMYIPTMALVTYILLSTFIAGLRGAFNPELLGTTATVAIAVTLLEILIIRTGIFLLAISSSSQLLDLVAYSGYKFVHVIVSLLLTNLATWLGLTSSWVRWVIFLYCFNANSFFLLRSLKYALLPDENSQHSYGTPAAASYTDSRSQKGRRTYFLFAYSYVVQFGFMVWLSKV